MEKLNIVEILKDCPTGMELDCAIYEDVYFDYVDELNIIHCYIQRETYRTSITFYQHGTPNSDVKSKCVIYPKGKTTWEGFIPPCKFKDGDVVYIQAINEYIAIYKDLSNEYLYDYASVLGNRFQCDSTPLSHRDYIRKMRFATEEEKQKLFDAIKANGYKWNAETKTLEKLIEPKFKVGDKIIKRNSVNNSWIVSSVSSEYYGLKLPNGSEGIGVLSVSEQDDWELMPVVPKFKVGDRIRSKKDASVNISNILITKVNERSYSGVIGDTTNVAHINFKYQDQYELVPDKFDINTLIPFESRVLVRDVDHYEWEGAIFGRYDGKKFFTIGGLDWGCCIPYEGNEHLIGTTNDCDEYFKTWK